MKIVQPSVRRLTGVLLDRGALREYLDLVGASDWPIPLSGPDEELLIEVMGRLCYRSWAPGLNPNVTRIRTDSAEYLENLLRSKHGSVLEHVQISFIFHNVSRVFTHELVRHRVGTAISQESMRYVRLTDIPVWIPPSLSSELDAHEALEFALDVARTMDVLERVQAKWSDTLELDTSKSFEHKKRMTSALRRFFSPTGVATSIGFSFNVRELRWVIQQRTSLAAEEEMRIMFKDVAEMMVRDFPYLFGDLRPNAEGEWWSPFDHPEMAMKESLTDLIEKVRNMIASDTQEALEHYNSIVVELKKITDLASS